MYLSLSPDTPSVGPYSSPMPRDLHQLGVGALHVMYLSLSPDRPVLIDSCITQRKAQGPSRTCTESQKEEEGAGALQVIYLSLSPDRPFWRSAATVIGQAWWYCSLDADAACSSFTCDFASI